MHMKFGGRLPFGLKAAFKKLFIENRRTPPSHSSKCKTLPGALEQELLILLANKVLVDEFGPKI